MSIRRIIYSKIEPSDEPPKMAKFMIEHKIARNEWQAMSAIFFIIIISVCFSILFISRFWPTGPDYISGIGTLNNIPIGMAVGSTSLPKGE